MSFLLSWSFLTRPLFFGKGTHLHQFLPSWDAEHIALDLFHSGTHLYCTLDHYGNQLFT